MGTDSNRFGDSTGMENSTKQRDLTGAVNSDRGENVCGWIFYRPRNANGIQNFKGLARVTTQSLTGMRIVWGGCFNKPQVGAEL